MRLAACILPWRRIRGAYGVDELEVYIIRRASTLATLAGFWAFAGGTVDAGDWLLAGGAPGTGLSGMPSDDLWQSSPHTADVTLRLCALRELFEETGLVPQEALMACPDQVQRDGLRRGLLQRTLSWTQAAAALGITTACAKKSLDPAGRWQTPPFAQSSYDAHYFALEIGSHQQGEVWPGELIAGTWVTTDRALAQHEAGISVMAYPVAKSLRVLDAAVGEPRRRVLAACATLSGEQTTAHRALAFFEHITLLPLRSPTLPPATHTNCYLLGKNQVVVVDPGCPDTDEQAVLFAALDKGGKAQANVMAVWLTHCHPDHIAAATAVSQRYGVPICAHADTAKLVSATVTVDQFIEDNEELIVDGRVWRALLTPGHAPGHLCFYDPQDGHLLAGDNVLGTGTSIVMPAPHGNMRAYIASLQRMRELRLGLLFCGHGPPVACAKKRIDDTLAQRIAREQLVLESVGKLQKRGERATVSALVALVYRGLGASLRGLAELSTRSHLEKLLDDGLLSLADGLPQEPEAFCRTEPF